MTTPPALCPACCEDVRHRVRHPDTGAMLWRPGLVLSPAYRAWQDERSVWEELLLLTIPTGDIGYRMRAYLWTRAPTPPPADTWLTTCPTCKGTGRRD